MEGENEKELCYLCKRQLIRDEISVSKKMINRVTQRYYCKSCLAEAFDITVSDIEAYIAELKRQGCTLFS